MDTCFLFTKHLDDKGCLSFTLSKEGTLIAPPLYRNFDEIKVLQKECKTTVVETTESATLIELELPWLPERKARIAIPYALEDKLAQSVEELHFSFDKQRYQNNRYTIAVISKQRMQHIMELLAQHDIKYEAITLDWFALSSQEMCISESTLLINNDDFKGSLSGEMARSYLKKHSLIQVQVFKDSQITPDISLPMKEEHSTTWIAQQLVHSRLLNLCQGEMQHGNASDWIKKGYQLVGVLACVWAMSLLLVNGLALHTLNKKTDEIDQKIAVIYREFFPDAKQVISPKFRISKLIGTSASDTQAHFWFLLNQFAKAVKGNPLTIEQLRYQNKTLSVTLVSADFASLEGIENKLKSLQLKVKQTQASTRDQQVVATLELM